MKHLYAAFAFTIVLALVLAGCDSVLNDPEMASDNAVTESQAQADARGSALEGLYMFAPPVFDIDATPNGSILVPETVFPRVEPGEGTSTTTIWEVRRNGDRRQIAEISTMEGSPINGLEAVGRGNFFATSGGMDLTVGAGLWRVSPGGDRLVADISAFELDNDTDATEGPAWKDPLCEFNPDAGFSAGPHSNPYHLKTLSGSEALVADAAGNTLLWAKTNGQIDWVAVFTPPTEDGTGSVDPSDWMVLFSIPEGPDCYVQPVPTAVDIGPDEAYYVGELTGVTPTDIDPTEDGPTTGLSRVWRIESGARNVTCPSDDCKVVLSGFTSVIDLEFGPDGKLYVVEYDENNWFQATELGDTAGGTINRCDVDDHTCDVVESGLMLPAAITFDKWGNLWLLENNLDKPTVHRVD